MPSPLTSGAARVISLFLKSLDKLFPTSSAFFSLQDRSTAELLRSYLVFRLCTLKPLVKHGASLLKLGESVSPSLTHFIVKSTFFAQFCAGEDAQSIQPTIRSLIGRRIGAILDYAAEADVSGTPAHQEPSGGVAQTSGSSASRSVPTRAFTTAASATAAPATSGSMDGIATPAPGPALPPPSPPSEAHLDGNLAISMAAIATAKDCGGFAAVKLSGLAEPDFLLQVSDVVSAHRSAWAALHGCAHWLDLVVARAADASTHSLSAWEAVRSVAAAAGAPAHELAALKSAVAPGGDGPISYSAWCAGLLRCAMEGNDAAQKDALAAVYRIGGRKDAPPAPLSPSHQQSWARVVNRGAALAQTARREGVTVLLDAEQTYLQGAVDAIACELMARYNRPASQSSGGASGVSGSPDSEQRPCAVYSTYQAYLRDARWRLGADMAGVRASGAIFGAKLVRGAYLTTERTRAADRGERDPTQASLDATHGSYASCASALLDAVRDGGACAMFATHNEDSVSSLAAAARALPPPVAPRVSFAQLLGMCDHLTEGLALSGIPVAKYVPYGPVGEVMPYLLRRAQENSDLLGGSSLGGAARELALLREELGRRVRARLATSA